MQKVVCHYCGEGAELVTGEAIYPHRQDLYDKRFWECNPCKAYVGCHPFNEKHNPVYDKPLGILANAALRQAKGLAHAAFDPIWRDSSLSRKEAYKWLSLQLGVLPRDCHIGMFGIEMCRRVVEICDDRA